VLGAGVPFEDEVRFRRADGEFRWFVVAAEPFRDEQGRILKWYGIGTDIEDRKRAEEELRAAEHEARELLERVPAMISLRTVAGIAFTNHRIEHQELEGGGRQKYIHPEDREHALANQTRSTEEKETMDPAPLSGWGVSLVPNDRGTVSKRGWKVLLLVWCRNGHR
jgi:PAS domain-containing protein